MAKLLLLTVCEKIIIDRVGLASLISIFQHMDIQIQEAPLPESAVSPIKWAVCAIWQHSTEDVGREFTQVTEIVAPNGAQFANASTKFGRIKTADERSTNGVDVFGLPIGAEGPITVRVRLENIPGTEGEYSFTVRHKKKEATNEATAPATVN